MTLVLLIRHGHTPTAGRILTGWMRGVHLSERGRAQAEALVSRLEGVPLEAIYSSPLERCRETAAPLARARGLRVRVRRDLLEVNYGEWSGRSIRELARTKAWRAVQRTPSAVRFPGGETLPEVQARAMDAVRDIAEAHPDGVVALVTHADVVRLALAGFLGAPLDLSQRLAIDPGSVSVVALADAEVRVLRVNDTGDLSALAQARPRRRTPRRVRG
ncbi:Phosphoserine phosphatase 1 [bacterium HR12]|nr:Phosphoserine phosphatase 1 [bacterium HR12]